MRKPNLYPIGDIFFFKSGFTLIELLITVTILAIVAAIAIPSFENLQRNARNATVKAALGGFREAIQIYRLNEIAHGRSTGLGGSATNGCPQNELQNYNQFAGPIYATEGGHPIPNVWKPESTAVGFITITLGDPRGIVVPGAGSGDWLYNGNTCEIWANSLNNGGVDDPISSDPTENWF